MGHLIFLYKACRVYRTGSCVCFFLGGWEFTSNQIFDSVHFELAILLKPHVCIVQLDALADWAVQAGLNQINQIFVKYPHF